MKSGRISFISATLGVLALQVHAQGVLVEPSRIEITTRCGTQVEQTIRVSSLSPVPTAVAFSLQSFTLDAHGQPMHRHSAALEETMSISADAAVISPSAHISVVLSITLPADARGTTTAVLFVEPQPEGKARVKTRIAVPIYVSAEGTTVQSAAIETLHAVALSREEIAVSAVVRNSGNALLRFPIAFAIEMEGGSEATEVASAEHPPFVILPGGVRVIEMRIHGAFGNLPNLRAIALYRYAEKSLATATERVSARPPEREGVAKT